MYKSYNSFLYTTSCYTYRFKSIHVKNSKRRNSVIPDCSSRLRNLIHCIANTYKLLQVCGINKSNLNFKYEIVPFLYVIYYIILSTNAFTLHFLGIYKIR